MNNSLLSGLIVHIIDDEAPIQRSLDFLLRAAGCHVEHWAGGEEFLGQANRAVPACVLMDIRMPGMDGLEVLKRMAQEGFDLPVIVMTGHGEVDLAVQAMKAGAVDFIVKPLQREKLLESLARSASLLADCEAKREREGWAKGQLTKLTEREYEVLDGLACGFPNKTIAFDLGISSRTVEVYRANVMSKLDVKNLADALRVAFVAGLGSETRWRDLHGGSPSPKR